MERNGPPPRPDGTLVWYHASSGTHVEAGAQLGDRLAQQRPGLHLLMTGTDTVLPLYTDSDSRVIPYPLPPDDKGAARTFVAHWQPDIGVWTAGDLQSSVLTAACRAGVPLFLADADESRLSRSGWSLVHDKTRANLRRFTAIMARDKATETHLRRRLGPGNATIRVTGALREQSKPLPCNDSDREELSRLLRGRPIWLAAGVEPEEIAAVLDANAAVSRMSHRVLLIVVPAVPEQIAPFRDALEKSGLRHIRWSEGCLPDEATQVILADTRGDLGLWYRIAPISFMGGSLVAGAHGCDPNEPAAHGSAILHGPNIRSCLSAYSGYAEAGAARIVRDAATLAEAVQDLIPPDRSADMASAAWDVATRSAAVMDDLVDTIVDALDRRGAG